MTLPDPLVLGDPEPEPEHTRRNGGAAMTLPDRATDKRAPHERPRAAMEGQR